MPEPERRQAIDIVHEAMTSVSYQGPIPPPAMLRGYNDINPGIADRIIVMAEREQAFRHEWENKALANDQKYAMTGLVAGWTTALGLAAGATFAGVYEATAVGVALAAASATGMVWKLVQGRSEEPRRVSADQEPSPKMRDSKS